jgi:hypothetical protein
MFIFIPELLKIVRSDSIKEVGVDFFEKESDEFVAPLSSTMSPTIVTSVNCKAQVYILIGEEKIILKEFIGASDLFTDVNYRESRIFSTLKQENQVKFISYVKTILNHLKRSEEKVYAESVNDANVEELLPRKSPVVITEEDIEKYVNALARIKNLVSKTNEKRVWQKAASQEVMESESSAFDSLKEQVTSYLNKLSLGK